MATKEDARRELQISFIETALQRATSYVTTNGMIHVTLCGLYATTVAVLVALAEQGNSAARPIIYEYIIPAFSFVILTVSFNVWSWIHEQLEYLSIFGRESVGVENFISFEAWLERADHHWNLKPRIRRICHLLFNVTLFYIRIPISMNNIYCYYFLLYVATPIVGILHMRNNIYIGRSLSIIVGLQLLAALIGLRRMIGLNVIQREVGRMMVAEAKT